MQVVLPSEKDVVDFQPNYDEIRKCPGAGLIITGVAPAESNFDFYTRHFAPKLGIDEVHNLNLLLSVSYMLEVKPKTWH